jgi:hypothetical protein
MRGRVALAVAPNGSVWLGMASGVLHFDGLADNWDTAIAAAPDGAVWIATDGGVSRYAPPRRRRFDIPPRGL